jgi:thioesterase domain-containing protein/acyl carrier protein
MVPSALVFLERLPLSPNGKVDRKALPQPEVARPEYGYVEPRTPIEAEVARVFAEVLGRKKVGINDNFFDLGGYSLLAVRLMAEIQKVFRRKIPLQVFFMSPTVGSLVQEIIGGAETASCVILKTVTPYLPNSIRVPIFFVAAPEADTLGYTALGRHLGDDQPVLVLQAHYRYNKDKPYTRTELKNLASEHIRIMRDVQPVGPYYIGGSCEGVHIAFEMARQLQAADEKVALMVSFDAWPEENTRTRSGSWLDSLRETVQRLKQPIFRMRRRDRGWGVWTTDGVEIHDVPGEQSTILQEPYVREVAKTLRKHLDSVKEG